MDLSPLDRVAESVLGGKEEEEIRHEVLTALGAGVAPRRVLEEGLLAAMDEVGVRFREGEMTVPEVVLAAKAMQSGLEILRPLLRDGENRGKGTVLTVTVEGDLHDLGVKLVGMMLEASGFEVINMGVDVPAQAIVDKVKEVSPRILALSAMLTTTMKNMKQVVDLLREEGLEERVVIMVGGVPLSPEIARKLGAHYSADAGEAVDVAKKLLGL